MDRTAIIDQITAEIGDIALLTRAYHKQLVKRGFSEEQAFQLARDWHLNYWSTLDVRLDESR